MTCYIAQAMQLKAVKVDGNDHARIMEDAMRRDLLEYDTDEGGSDDKGDNDSDEGSSNDGDDNSRRAGSMNNNQEQGRRNDNTRRRIDNH